MPNLLDLSSWDDQGRLRVVVETPRGSAFKIHYDPATLAFTLQRGLQGRRYPHDWGFVPGTLADDGDPLDAMVVHEDATWPGIVLPSTPIGLLKIRDQKPGTDHEVKNDRVIAVPSVSSSRTTLSDELRADLEQFLRATGEQAGKRVRVLGWGDANEACSAIEQAQRH